MNAIPISFVWIPESEQMQQRRRSMEKAYTTTCIVSNEKGEHFLQTVQGRIIPGNPFVPDSSASIRLAGGFPALTPDTPFILSPTLQLNSDLTHLTEESSLTLAEAELQRHQRVTVRSYHADVDSRVCVISKDVNKLDSFIDNYGGVLDIEPLLLAGSHPEHPFITELEFESTSPQITLRLRKRAPLNKEKCTYCGACGQVCPEKCISAQLFFDYSRCSWCKECEKACQENAIDIYGVEEIVLQTPAVILLGEVNVELPDERQAIYREEQLSEFFKTIYSAEIQEVVCHNNSICQYSSRLGTGCGLCVDRCPHGALSRDGAGIAIDHFECQDCGVCMAVCPTGAMQNGNFGDSALLDYLKEVAELLQGKELVVGEEAQLHNFWWQHRSQRYENTFFLEYSLNSLSLYHFLLFLAAGAKRVILLTDNQVQITSELIRQTTLANTISSAFLGHELVSQMSSEEYINPVDQNNFQPKSFLSELSVYRNRRATISQVLHQLISSSGTSLAADALDGEFVSLSCDTDGCTQCLACLNECKVKALQADEENLSLTYLAGHCVGCGVCVSVCPEKVLAIETAINLDENYFTPQVIAQAEAVACKSCGKVFGTRKSLERVMEILSARESVNTDHFEYCSTCRVINLFETEKT